MYNVYAHHILCVFLCAFVHLYTHIHTRILLHDYNQVLRPVHSKDTFIMQSREKNKITYRKCHQLQGMEVKEIYQSSRLP